VREDIVEQFFEDTLPVDYDYLTRKVEKKIETEAKIKKLVEGRPGKKKYDDRLKRSKGKLKHGGSKRKDPKIKLKPKIIKR
jgi:hypothetical protein